MFVFKDGGGNRTRRCGWESVPEVAFDARGLGKMFTRVLVRQYTGSGLMDPLVAAGMVEVPVGVDQLLDGIRVDARESFRDMRTCGNDCRINQQLSVRASENGDIPASTQKNADVAAKILNRDFSCGGFFECAR